MNRGRIFTVAAAALIALLALGSPAAAQYGATPVPGPSTALGNAPASTVPGQQIPCDGPPGSFDQNSTVECFFESAPVLLGRTTARSDGSFSLLVSIPANATSGTHTLSARGARGGAPVTYARTVTVVGGGAPVRLPVTGSEIVLFAVWGLFLLGFGAALVSATWRRYRAAKTGAPVRRRKRREPEQIIITGDDEPEMLELEETDVVMPVRRSRQLVGAGVASSSTTEWDAADVLPPARLPDDDTQPAPIAGASGPDIDSVARRASERTSEVVSRLQDEIRSWTRRDDA